MSLKEKGRRLLVNNKIEIHQIDIIQKILNDESIQLVNERLQRKASNIFTNEGLKGKFDRIIEHCNKFEVNATLHQERNTHLMRRKLKHDLDKFKTFTQKNEYIDKKIEYDQRFYNDGYAQFQLMISDIRKQIRLNDQVMQLRRQLRDAYTFICNADDCDIESHHHDSYKV